MKKYPLIIFFVLAISWQENKFHSPSEGSWSGDVQFTEIRIGRKITVYQHHMVAIITNDSGTATHSLTIDIQDKYSLTCNGQGSSYLEVGVDEEDNTYSIFASVPGCRGTRTSAAGNVELTGEDETGITVPNQPLRGSRNSLTGSFIKTDTTTDYTITTTTYRWNLTKSN